MTSSFSFSFETYDAREGTTSVSTREGREAEEDGEQGMEGMGMGATVRGYREEFVSPVYCAAYIVETRNGIKYVRSHRPASPFGL